MNYGYARVSTIAQNADRQLSALREHVEKIYVDKQSGKDFERAQYNALLAVLQKGDCLFVKSIDRFGRNYKEILEQWRVLTKVKEVDVVVLDMPLIDTRTEKNLLGTFISDLVLQILAFVAENERAYINQRSKEGLALARLRGVKLGRPKRLLPANFNQIVADWNRKELSCKEAAALARLPAATFRRRAKELLEEIHETILGTSSTDSS